MRFLLHPVEQNLEQFKVAFLAEHYGIILSCNLRLNRNADCSTKRDSKLIQLGSECSHRNKLLHRLLAVALLQVDMVGTLFLPHLEALLNLELPRNLHIDVRLSELRK